MNKKLPRHKKSAFSQRKPLITALESRILLDGAAVATAADATTDVAFQRNTEQASDNNQNIEPEAAPVGENTDNRRREIAFVDTQIKNFQTIVDGIGEDIEIHLLDGAENGLESMLAGLEGQQDIEAIHVFSHGDTGALSLGSLALNSDNLADNASLLQELGESVSESGDILLYGCEVGSDNAGLSFINQLAELTGADVIASDDLTGSKTLGGDWDLEIATDNIEATPLSIDAFDGVLNNAPQIQPDVVTGEITAGDVLSRNGSLTFTDAEPTDRPTATQEFKSITGMPPTPDIQAVVANGFTITNDPGNTNNGTVTWDYTVADADLDFLNEGATLTATFTITVTDDNGLTAEQDVTITIIGTNNVPEIEVVDVDGAITKGSVLSDNGSINVSDSDMFEQLNTTFAHKEFNTDLTLDTTQENALIDAFSITDNRDTVTWDYIITETELDFLGDNEIVEAVFTITVTDREGATATQDVTITITGLITNDAPTITGATNVDGAVTEGNGDANDTLTDTGNFAIADVDLTDVQSVSAVPMDDDYRGTFTPSVGDNTTDDGIGQIDWQFTVADADIEDLATGQILTQIYTVTVDDGNGGTVDQLVTITITGTNDAPQVELTNIDEKLAFGKEYFKDMSSLFSDHDSSDNGEDLDFQIAGLPTGLTYEPETGVISGQPKDAGKFTITLTATDIAGAEATRTYQLEVLAPPIPDASPTPEIGEVEDINNPLIDLSSGLDQQDGVSDNGFEMSRGFIASETTSLDTGPQNENFGGGKKVIMAAVDVNVNSAGEVVFSGSQQEAISQLSMSISGINNNPGQWLVVELQDAQARSVETYTGSMANGGDLPTWISIDPETGHITIDHSSKREGEIELRVNAIGDEDEIRVLQLKLDLDELTKQSSNQSSNASKD